MGDRKNAEPEDSKKSCEALSSWQDMAAAVAEFQALHMSALDLHKNGPIPSEPPETEGAQGDLPSTAELLLVDSWEEKTVAFG